MASSLPRGHGALLGGDTLDAMLLMVMPEEVMELCLDPNYKDCIEQFLAGVETRVVRSAASSGHGIGGGQPSRTGPPEVRAPVPLHA